MVFKLLVLKRYAKMHKAMCGNQSFARQWIFGRILHFVIALKNVRWGRLAAVS
jgi:hypothetical protein